MVLSNWAFAATFAAAVAGCVVVLLIVWVERPKQDRLVSQLKPLELRLLYFPKISRSA